MTCQLAKILADSISPAGVRLTTMEVVMPRIVLAEFNTHRTFCLAGDAELEFDLPAGRSGCRRVYKMRLDEFVDKWLHGARRYAANPKREYALGWVEPHVIYNAMEAASLMGMSAQHAINAACRQGKLESCKGADGRTWEFTGQALLDWRASKPKHTRFDMRAKLSGMSIRQLNEATGDIQTANVVGAVESGMKDVFELIAGDFSVAGSRDHRVFTPGGWKTIGELKPGDYIVVRKFGKHEDEKLDPLRLKKINGKWRNLWQSKKRQELVAEDENCRRCGARPGVEIHHIEPVYKNPQRAFDETNITLLCAECHSCEHAVQGWQTPNYLYGAAVAVEEVVYRGKEKTYDLTISGDFPNFLANGVVVHNSRNSASSRAIPVEKMMRRVIEDPYTPERWGSNGKGMQDHGELGEVESHAAERAWLKARDNAVLQVRELLDIGVHKQTTNRLLEPFMWHTVIVTATEWSNFFNLRCHPMAHPAIRRTAEAMREAMESNEPEPIAVGEWHLPLVDERDAELSIEDKVKASAARCARVSYLTHDGVRSVEKDLELYERLVSHGHMSPLEHPATPMDPWGMGLETPEETFAGNFRGWIQDRKTIHGEEDILSHREG